MFLSGLITVLQTINKRSVTVSSTANYRTAASFFVKVLTSPIGEHNTQFHSYMYLNTYLTS